MAATYALGVIDLDQTVALIRAQLARLTVTPNGRPVMVAIDGRSGAGKSTLAVALRVALGAVVVPGDDFYGGGSLPDWASWTREERADRCVDWRRQVPVLRDLRERQPTTWRAYDWDAFDGSFSAEPQSCGAADLIVLEGVYSARPELRELIDLRILLALPDSERDAQLRDREGDDYRESWEAMWASAEDHYFDLVMPAAAFDLVIGPDGPAR